MKYYINGRFLTQRITGVQRYAREITIALDQILQERKKVDDEYYLLAPKDNIVEEIPCKVILVKQCGKLSGHLWEQIDLPWLSKDGFLLNLCNCAPLVKKNQIVTIHDASIAVYPQAYSWKFRYWYRIMFAIFGKRLHTVLTVSHFSRKELSKYFGIPRESICVTYNGVEHLRRIPVDESILKRIPKNYVLAVSSQNPTKNFNLILKAAELMPDVHFVIAGGRNNKVFQRKSERELTNVYYAGYVSDSELVSLYKNAEMFIYPSLYEGFGIPPLEAMYFGCPVIVSNIPPLKEVCGDAALYCEPHDSGRTLQGLIRRVLDDSSLRYRMSKQGREQTGKYSWKYSAELIDKLVREQK